MIPPKAPAGMAPDMPEMPAPPMDDMAGPDLEASGRQRRAEVASQALAGGDPSTLPAETQDAIQDVAAQLAKATHAEHILQGGIEDAVALIASAHAFLTAQGSQMAPAIDPAQLTDPNKALMLVAGMQAILSDPETMELFQNGAAAPEGQEMEPEPEGPMEPEPMMME